MHDGPDEEEEAEDGADAQQRHCGRPPHSLHLLHAAILHVKGTVHQHFIIQPQVRLGSGRFFFLSVISPTFWLDQLKKLG